VRVCSILPKTPERLNLVPRPAELVSSLDKEEHLDQGEVEANDGTGGAEGEDCRYLICDSLLSQQRQ